MKKSSKYLACMMSLAMAATAITGCGSSASEDTASAKESETTAAESTEKEADEAEDSSSASSGEGAVYMLNFKPETDEAWQQLASDYEKETGVEAARHSDIGQRAVGGTNQLDGAAHALIDDIFNGRYAVIPLEQRGKIGGADVHNGGQLRQADILGQVVFNIGSHLVELAHVTLGQLRCAVFSDVVIVAQDIDQHCLQVLVMALYL